MSHRPAGGGGAVGEGLGTRCVSKRGKNANLKTLYVQKKKNCWRNNCSPISSSVGMRDWNGAWLIADTDAAGSISCDQPEGIRVTSLSCCHRPVNMKAQHQGAGWRCRRLGFIIWSVEWLSCTATARPTGGRAKRPVDVTVMLHLSQS